VCPAHKPRAEHCRYYASAAAAERRGFRPCLRCRPELAPGTTLAPNGTTASIDAVRRLAHAAAARIAAGALDRGRLDALAAELGVTARHLRRAVERELGATPVELAQTRRLLTAKQLLCDTSLPVTQVALASGFRSVRRFNALFHDRYRMAPSALRRRARSPHDNETPVTPVAPAAETISLSLAYRPPLDWRATLDYLAARATPGVEAVAADGRYWRGVQLHGHSGYIALGPAAAPRRAARHASSGRANGIVVEVSVTLLPVLVPLLARLRSLLDLDADPRTIAAQLSADPTLAPLIARRPGLRVPGAVDGFELALRTVLGQQVSVRGATTLAGRLARLIADPLPATPASRTGAPPAPLTHLPVTAERLADASPAMVAGIGLPRTRAECIVTLARAVASGELPALTGEVPVGDPATHMRELMELPGVGPWTATYIAMRALRWPDAFPEGDLALRKAMGGLSPARLRAAAERWRPWRAYAAQHLWASLGDEPGVSLT
jgi:AraC family transcriptional regulator of adaptative response / DNA-3-methyladenine glycosylase II